MSASVGAGVNGEGVGGVEARAAVRPSQAVPGRTFATELARVRAAPARAPGGSVQACAAPSARAGGAIGSSSGVSALALAAALTPATALAMRRRGHEEGQRELGQRREEAEPGPGPAAPVGTPVAALPEPTAEVAAPQPPASGSLLATAGLERLSLAAERGGAPALLLAFGPELHVRLAQAGAAPGTGVDLRLGAPPAARAAALAELERLAVALRGRGIGLASAELFAPDSQVRLSAGGALTRQGPPGRRAAASGRGTVAKW